RHQRGQREHPARAALAAAHDAHLQGIGDRARLVRRHLRRSLRRHALLGASAVAGCGDRLGAQALLHDHMMKTSRWILAATAAFATSAFAQLSDTEQRIVAAVKQRSPAALQLLEKSVRINSGTLNPEGVRTVGEIYRAELDGLGFATRWVDM